MGLTYLHPLETHWEEDWKKILANNLWYQIVIFTFAFWLALRLTSSLRLCLALPFRLTRRLDIAAICYNIIY